MRPVLLLAVLTVACGSAAHAQTAVTAKRRPTVPRLAPRQAPAAPLPAPSAPPARLTLTGLRAPGDGGATCRSSCARVRYACEVQEESCAPDWGACLKSCSDAARAPPSALLPR